MAILNESKFGRSGYREIDISGPAGNAFSLMGQARSFGKQLGWSNEVISKITADMMSGDYENLLQVFDTNFGSFCDLVRFNGEIDEDEDDDYIDDSDS
jgi:hypothetical protein